MELPQAPAPRCIHLTSNSTLIHGEGYESDQGDRSGATHCTCVKTGRALGPDGAAVGNRACSDPDRDCYEEY